MVVRMANHAIWFFIFFVSLFEVVPQTKISAHGNNNAFMQTNSDVRYLVDGIPVPVHKELVGASSVRVPGLEETSVYSSKPYLKFNPPLLDFKERYLGIPHHEKVILLNVNSNKTIHMSSISGNTVHFHSSFFEDKVIPPLGNTTFNVVFLGREEGEIESNLFIHTSEGSFKYHVKGSTVRSPYRLRPLVGVRVPLNATYSPLINMYNPHPTPIQLLEVFSSGGEFHLELPSGELEGPKHLWEIPPFHTKPVIRIRFVARAEKNHTAYVRIKLNKSEEVLIVPLEVEVSSQPGLYSSDDIINFGIGGSHDRPQKVKLALYNSLKKVIRVQSVVTASFSKAVKIDFQPIKVPPDPSSPTQIATLTFDWGTAYETKQFTGKIVIKSKQNQHKLVIPYVAQVLEGGLEYNTSVTQYCSDLGHQLRVRNFTVRNDFKTPVALTNVSLQKDAEEYFTIQKFSSLILNPGEMVVLFQIVLRQGNLPQDFRLKSHLLLHSNVSTVYVPLLCYNGRLTKVVVSEFNETKLNFGTVGSASQREAHFALFNHNPVAISIEDWGTNFTGAVADLLGVAEGNRSSLEGRQNFNNMNLSNVLEPNWYAVFRVVVVAAEAEEEVTGDAYVTTPYERVLVPMKMRVAHGRLEILPDPLILDNCFPGKLCRQTLQVRSLFSRAMTITSITSVPYDPRVNFWIANTSAEITPLATSTIGELRFDPSTTCGGTCYLGVDMNSTAGSQWLHLLELPSHVHDLDLSMLSARYASYLRLAGDKSSFPVWQNVSLQLHTTEVRRHTFWVKVMMTWPLLAVNAELLGNTSVLTFPLTQIGNTTYKDLVIHNPSSKPLTVQLVMDWAYPVADRLLHDLSNGLSQCPECRHSIAREFTLEEGSYQGSHMHKLLGVMPHKKTLLLVLQPGEVATTRLGFTPQKPGLSSAVLLIRNNLTILEIVRLSGRAAHAHFKFGNRKPGSDAPLMFELAEKHLKDCEREKNRKFPVPNLTVKRSFTARNTGELPIYVRGFYINGLPCEGYGFRVLNCVPFQLQPNGTRKVDIAFTPDFTLARIQRMLSIDTSLGISVNYSLITTLPPYFLSSCSSVLGRPNWEPLLYYSAISFMTFILFCVLAAAFLESDRILKYAFGAMTKDKALRTESKLTFILKNGDIRTGCTKPEGLTDWHMNGSVFHHGDRRHRESNGVTHAPSNHMYHKASWNSEDKHIEEPHTKEKSSKFDDAEGGYSSNTTPLMVMKNKKKLSKKNSNNSDHTPVAEPVQELSSSKKGWGGFLTRSTASHQTKPKISYVESKSSIKNTTDVETSIKKTADTLKENKKFNQNNKKNNRNTVDTTVSYEEETSSTTTESSNNDDIEKERDTQSRSIDTKVSPKKDKGKALDDKDHYEGDCDEEEEDCESFKKDFNSQWKPNSKNVTVKLVPEAATTKVTSIEALKPASLELPYKLKSSKIVNRERKDKNVLKKRTADKNGTVRVSGPNGSCSSSSSSCSNSSVGASNTLRVSPPLRTPSNCWGEHRASFSDVVARSDSTLYSNIVAPRKRQPTISPTSLPTVFSENNIRLKPSDVTPTSSISSSGLGPIGSKKPSSPWDVSESQHPLPFLQQPQDQASLFVDALTEPTPVETNEEKSNSLPYNGDVMWEASNPMGPLLEEEPRKMANDFQRQDVFRESWPGVDSLWEPMYTPVVDNTPLFTPSLRNEDIRSPGSVWGSLIGSVWSSSTWSNAPGPVAPPLNCTQAPLLSPGGPSTAPAPATSTTLTPPGLRHVRQAGMVQEEENADIDRGLGFDPFRSLNTIWFPASSDSWNPAGNK